MGIASTKEIPGVTPSQITTVGELSSRTTNGEVCSLNKIITGVIQITAGDKVIKIIGELRTITIGEIRIKGTDGISNLVNLQIRIREQTSGADKEASNSPPIKTSLTLSFKT